MTPMGDTGESQIKSGQGYPVLKPVGDSAICIEFGDEINDRVNDLVYSAADALNARSPSWLRELVPTYRSLLVHYDALAADYDEVRSDLLGLAASDSAAETSSSGGARQVFELPTVYGGEFGPDLDAVASHAGLDSEDVVRIHSSIAYRVYMIGFAPGFPYLGGMDQSIATPRLATPRTRVPAGSVGIAESQTGVYPAASPGGWQLIGQTPVQLFDAQAQPPSVLQPGHFVKFVPVDESEFQRIQAEVANGQYRVAHSEFAS